MFFDNIVEKLVNLFIFLTLWNGQLFILSFLVPLESFIVFYDNIFLIFGTFITSLLGTYFISKIDFRKFRR